MAEPNVIAAVDLGSNSFHMVVATLRHGQLTIIDRLRETVRLAEGLSARNELSADAKNRALACLSRFGERLRDMQAESVRAAGTNTLRLVSRDLGFIDDAEAALGHPIEIISGIEEARLVYLGVAHSLPPHGGRRLVMDIGGGSTELIAGSGFESSALESLSMGCVSVTETYFGNGDITAEAFADARLMVRLKLRPVKSRFRSSSDMQVIGASGTIRATEAIIRELGWLGQDGLTPANVQQLIDLLMEQGGIASLALPGLSERRAEVLPGGLAILIEVLRTLRITQMRVSDGALREGLLYDLLGRIRHEDARVATVSAMVSRYHVDVEQAERVAATAENLRSRVAESWQLTAENQRLLLLWASLLHEVGFDIAHENFHEHGAYVVGNADMPGFPRLEQQVLAYLLAEQRKNFDDRGLKRLPESRRELCRRLAIVLRLAVLLHRNRSSEPLPDIAVAAGGSKIGLTFPESWLTDTPLTLADLGREAKYLSAVGYELNYS